jgi:hypothetical protein
MKYSNIFLGVFAFMGLGLLASCDVNDEFYDELDKEETGVLVEDLEYSLVEADYEFFKSDEDEVKNKIASYKNFSKDYTAAQYMPEFLNDKYAYLDKNSTAVVTYNYYQGSLYYLYDFEDYKDELDALESYELSSDDYDSMGEDSGEPGKYDNFSSTTLAADYLPAFLSAKYTDAETGFSVYMTYKYYNDGVFEINEFWTFDGTTWAVDATIELPVVPVAPEGVEVYELSADDYDSMGDGPGYKDNFSSSVPADQYLPVFLGSKYPYAQDGDKVAVIFRYYKGKIDGVRVTEWDTKEYAFDGSVWNEYSKVIEQVANFKRNADSWAYVPPIKLVKSDEDFTKEYTVSPADYDFVGDVTYDNFYVKGMSAEDAESSIISKLTKILKANFDLVVGDVYEVSYVYYDGETHDAKMKLEAVADN